MTSYSSQHRRWRMSDAGEFNRTEDGAEEFAGVASTPLEDAREVVACSQWQHCHLQQAVTYQ